MRQFFAKHRVLAFVVGVALAASAGAAAWTIFNYTGITGSGQGNFSHATTSTVGALTYTGGQSSPATLDPQANLDPGNGLGSVTIPITIHNNDPASPHTVASLSSSFTSTPAHCATKLQWANTSSVQVGTVVPAGGNVVGSVDVEAQPDLFADCSDGTWTISFSGTTT